eukprot:CAMPEP_0206597346 /NCGR_PEP_ID=MMETSP0325_2-20121206/44059_1 /ASSEMBLY_ACC=CAM_ASM_000347 /TAXON_ID=2866 /ORGANISM="Crypthecodinium cohnii, Strain Seligo" /LENGTH=277 /DNA_ID=CAMNT_0054108269 /DNA_START=367 /DNA_END=1202 /DNA_ORIENTATION=-
MARATVAQQSDKVRCSVTVAWPRNFLADTRRLTREALDECCAPHTARPSDARARYTRAQCRTVRRAANGCMSPTRAAYREPRQRRGMRPQDRGTSCVLAALLRGGEPACVCPTHAEAACDRHRLEVPAQHAGNKSRGKPRDTSRDTRPPMAASHAGSTPAHPRLIRAERRMLFSDQWSDLLPAFAGACRGLCSDLWSEMLPACCGPNDGTTLGHVAENSSRNRSPTNGRNSCLWHDTCDGPAVRLSRLLRDSRKVPRAVRALSSMTALACPIVGHAA